MRISICAQSCASVPPAPAWMSRKQLCAVHLAREHALELEAARSRPRCAPTSCCDRARPCPRRRRPRPSRAVRRPRRGRRVSRSSVPTTPRAWCARGPVPARAPGLLQTVGSSSSPQDLGQALGACPRSQRYPLSALGALREVVEGAADRVGFHCEAVEPSAGSNASSLSRQRRAAIPTPAAGAARPSTRRAPCGRRVRPTVCGADRRRAARSSR